MPRHSQRSLSPKGRSSSPKSKSPRRSEKKHGRQEKEGKCKKENEVFDPELKKCVEVTDPDVLLCLIKKHHKAKFLDKNLSILDKCREIVKLNKKINDEVKSNKLDLYSIKDEEVLKHTIKHITNTFGNDPINKYLSSLDEKQFNDLMYRFPDQYYSSNHRVVDFYAKEGLDGIVRKTYRHQDLQTFIYLYEKYISKLPVEKQRDMLLVARAATSEAMAMNINYYVLTKNPEFISTSLLVRECVNDLSSSNNPDANCKLILSYMIKDKKFIKDFTYEPNFLYLEAAIKRCITKVLLGQKLSGIKLFLISIYKQLKLKMYMLLILSIVSNQKVNKRDLDKISENDMFEFIKEFLAATQDYISQSSKLVFLKDYYKNLKNYDRDELEDTAKYLFNFRRVYTTHIHHDKSLRGDEKKRNKMQVIELRKKEKMKFNNDSAKEQEVLFDIFKVIQAKLNLSFTDLKYCFNKEDILGEPIDEKNETTVFQRYDEKSGKLYGDCYPTEQIINVTNTKNKVYLWIPRKGSPDTCCSDPDAQVFKMPTGYWVLGSRVMLQSFRYFCLIPMGPTKIGSSFGMSNLHNVSEFLWRAVPVNKEVIQLNFNDQKIIPPDEKGSRISFTYRPNNEEFTLLNKVKLVIKNDPMSRRIQKFRRWVVHVMSNGKIILIMTDSDGLGIRMYDNVPDEDINEPNNDDDEPNNQDESGDALVNELENDQLEEDMIRQLQQNRREDTGDVYQDFDG